MKLNFELFKRFKNAAEAKGLEVKPGASYYSIVLPNHRYIYCWTPLNKMWSLINYYDSEQWDRALDQMRDNFSDFHLEIDSLGYTEDVAECFYKEMWNPNITQKEIENIIDILQDDHRLNRRRLLATIEQESTE